MEYPQWLPDQWWWAHFALLGLFAGSTIGLWAYRDVWYSAATFFAAPVAFSRPFVTLRQWLAALILVLPSTLTVVLCLTAPLVYRHVPSGMAKAGVIVLAAGIWFLLLWYRIVRSAKDKGQPKFFENPFRWGRYRASQSPDRIGFDWRDTVLGIALHGGLAGFWFELAQTGRTSRMWTTLGIACSVVYVIVVTSLSVLIHPKGVSHESPSEENPTPPA